MLYNVEGRDYEVIISYKRIRNIHFRFENDIFQISCPRMTPIREIRSGLDKFAKKLIERNVKTQALGEDYIYLFGQRIDVSFPGSISLNDETKINFKDPNDLLKKLRKIFLNYVIVLAWRLLEPYLDFISLTFTK